MTGVVGILVFTAAVTAITQTCDPRFGRVTARQRVFYWMETHAESP